MVPRRSALLLGLGLEAAAADPTYPLGPLAEAVNTRPGVRWRAGPDRRFGGNVDAMRRQCGVKADLSREEAIAQGLAEPAGAVSMGEVPDTFDAAAAWPECKAVIDDIRDQGQCGSCWAFATASAASDRMCISNNATEIVPLSAQHMAFCGAGAGCSGGYLPNAWLHITVTGLVSGGGYNASGPFGPALCANYCVPPSPSLPLTPQCEGKQEEACPTSCDAHAAPPHSVFAADRFTYAGHPESPGPSVQDIQQSLLAWGPLTAAFNVYEDFEVYQSGVYHHVAGSEKPLGGHAVKLVGWGVENGTEYWKVANSWGLKWGEQGFFRILRGTNECGIEAGVYSSSAGATWSHKK